MMSVDINRGAVEPPDEQKDQPAAYPPDNGLSNENIDPAELLLAQTTPLEPLPEQSAGLPSDRVAAGAARGESRKTYLRAARCSSVGPVRPRNEDACLTLVAQSEGNGPVPHFGLFLVADGMGGHHDGHIASQLVSRVFAEHIMRTLYLPLLRAEEPMSRRPVQEVMEEAVQLANKALYRPEQDQVMGTTLTAALILGSRLFVAHVGDSRAYVLHGEQLSTVTTDHTLVQALQEAGELTVEEAASHPSRSLLYRALVGEEVEQVDIFSRSLPAEGMLMLCSDGLWGSVPETELQAVLRAAGSLQDKAEKLVQMAVAAGGHDNITVVLVDFQV